MALFRPTYSRRTVFRLIGAPSNTRLRKLAASFTIPARTYCSEADRPAYSNNPFYKKYADRIKELERRDPEALKRRQEEISRTLKTKAAGSTSGEGTPSPNPDNDCSGLRKPKDHRDGKFQQEPTYVRPSKFDADAVRELRSRCKTTAELTDAWKALHLARDAVCAVIPGFVYETIRERAKDYPVFLYPLPRDGSGYEFVLSQFVGDQCHMTPLASYQRHGSDAPACLALTYWTQLASRENGDVVLMSGEYDAKVIGPTEAQCLVNQLQLYYGGNELRKKLLLWSFNREPHSFKHEMLIREFEASVTHEQDKGSSVRQG